MAIKMTCLTIKTGPFCPFTAEMSFFYSPSSLDSSQGQLEMLLNPNIIVFPKCLPSSDRVVR